MRLCETRRKEQTIHHYGKIQGGPDNGIRSSLFDKTGRDVIIRSHDGDLIDLLKLEAVVHLHKRKDGIRRGFHVASDNRDFLLLRCPQW